MRVLVTVATRSEKKIAAVMNSVEAIVPTSRMVGFVESPSEER